MPATARIASLLSGAALALGLVLSAAPAAHAGGNHGNDEKGQGHRVVSESRADVDTSDWPQGKSLSDPDGDSNGGWDKPGFHGEDDGEDDGDRDGNNGCGNDEDRSDDNNGNCGGEAEPTVDVEGDEDADVDEPCADDNHGSRVKAVATSRDGDHHGSKVSAVAKSNDADCPDHDTTDDGTTDDDTTVSPAGTETRTQFGAAGIPTSVLGATEVAPAETTTTATTTPGTQVLGISEMAPDTLARTGAGLGALALAGGLCFGGGRLAGLIRRRLGS